MLLYDDTKTIIRINELLNDFEIMNSQLQKIGVLIRDNEFDELKKQYGTSSILLQSNIMQRKIDTLKTFIKKAKIGHE